MSEDKDKHGDSCFVFRLISLSRCREIGFFRSLGLDFCEDLVDCRERVRGVGVSWYPGFQQRDLGTPA